MNTWNDCITKGEARKITPDTAKAKSLIQTAQGRIEFLHKITLEESNANYLFEGYYSSLIELMHALVLINGFKITNHVCLGNYIRDILDKQKWYHVFDDCRYKRNALVYYGRHMDYDTCKDALQKCQQLITELGKHLKKLA